MSAKGQQLLRDCQPLQTQFLQNEDAQHVIFSLKFCKQFQHDGPLKNKDISGSHQKIMFNSHPNKLIL